MFSPIGWMLLFVFALGLNSIDYHLDTSGQWCHYGKLNIIFLTGNLIERFNMVMGFHKDNVAYFIRKTLLIIKSLS